MRPHWITLVVLLAAAACQSAPTPMPPAATVTPTPLPNAPPTLPPPTAAPTPTALAEGFFLGLATPNPAANCPDLYPWFFPNRADECGQTVLNTWVVMQAFEGGWMVWRQEGGHTYVLVDDGSPFKPYRLVTDTVTADLLGPDPALAPPPGRYQPVLGFAKFWRGLTPGTEWVREALGWALAPETPYSALWQCNTIATRCYFTGPRDEVIALTLGEVQHWGYWQGPVR